METALPDRQRSLLKRRLWIALALTAVLAALGAGHEFVGGHVFSGVWVARLKWLELSLAALAVFWPGWPLIERARTQPFDVATFAAYTAWCLCSYGLLSILTPQLWPVAWRDVNGSVAMHFELVPGAIAVALFVVLLRARGRSS